MNQPSFEMLHFTISSMQYSDSSAQIEADMVALLDGANDTRPDAVGFTEADKNRVSGVIAKVARDHGYHVFDPPRGDGVIIVHKRNQFLAANYIKTLDANTGMPKGNYSEKGICEVHFLTPAGNQVCYFGTHFLTAYQLDRRPGHENRREERYGMQLDAMAATAKRVSQHRNLGFWFCDSNIPEDKDTGFDKDAMDASFSEAKMVSIWDELRDEKDLFTNRGGFPGTHGGVSSSTIDIVGKCENDRRSDAHSVRVRRRRRFSDHDVVDAWYKVANTRF